MFEEYRKILAFRVAPFNLDKLNGGTMKLAAFISAVNDIKEGDISAQVKGKVWDAAEELCKAATMANSALLGANEQKAPSEITKKYKTCTEKLASERKKRAEHIAGFGKTSKELTDKLSGEHSKEEIAEIIKGFSALQGEVEDYCGKSDRDTKEYKSYNETISRFQTKKGTAELQWANRTIARLTKSLGDSKWTDAFLKENKSAFDTADYAAAALIDEHGKYVIQASYVAQLRSSIKAYNQAYTVAKDERAAEAEILALLDGVLKGLTKYSEEAERAVNECFGFYEKIKHADKLTDGLRARILDSEKLVAALKTKKLSDDRVCALNKKIDEFVSTSLNEYNVFKLEPNTQSISTTYMGMSEDEKKQVHYQKYLDYLPIFKAYLATAEKRRKRQNRLWDIQYGFKSFFRAIGRGIAAPFKGIGKAFKFIFGGGAFLDWLSTVWIVLVLAGLTAGAYFLAKTSWYFTAPSWLLKHSVKLWSWHHWGNGDAFGVVGALLDSGMNWFLRVILFLPSAAVDLLVFVLQAIWWLLSVIVWPLRWLFSRLAGLILYGIAYGLIGLLAVGASAIVIIVNFTDDKHIACRVINVILCVGVAVTAYLFLFLIF